MKKFDIFGTKYKLKYVDRIDTDDKEVYIWGDTDGRVHTIQVSTKDINGKPLNEDDKEITLFHELMHVIFSEGQYKDCNVDEPLVEWCARCLHSLKKQGIL